MAGGSNLLTRIVISARDEASSVFTSMQAKVAAVATAIAGFFGVSLFRASVTSAREFESAMSAVQAAAGATAEEMAALESAAKEAGASTQYSAVEAAGALNELVKAGLSASDAVKALPAALDLATAGGVGLAEAAGFLTQAVAGLGLTFEHAGRVADVLAQGANASQTSVEGLAQALSYAAPMANSLGLSLEDTVAYLGKFADAGIDASRAGTGLNSIMAQFLDPASKFREALRQAGISTGDFAEAIRQMAAAGPGAERALLAVGTEAGPALRALLNQGIGALDELRGKLLDSEGSARTFAAVMSSNLDGAFKGLGSAWDSLKISLGEPVLDTLNRQVTAVATRLRAFVADGTAKQFGETIREAFESAGKWAADFFGRVDFSQLAADMRQYASDLQATLTDIGNKATQAGNVLSLAWATMSTGIAAVRTAIYSLGAGMSWMASAFLADLAKITDGLAKITFGDLSAGFSEAAERMREEARATYAVYQEFTAKSGEAFAGIVEGAEEVSDAWAKVTASTAAAAPAVERVASAAADAGAAAQKMAEGTALLGKSFAELGINSQQVAGRLAEISTQTGVLVTSSRQLYDAVIEGTIAFDAATGAWSKGAGQLSDITAAFAAGGDALVGFKQGLVDSAAGAKQLGDQTGDTAAKIAALTAQYKEFIAAGDTQGAAGVLVQIEALKELGRQAKQTGVDVEESFAALGVTSSAELKRLADEARGHFEKIKASGTASTTDIQAAFEAYAVKAVAANDGVVEANLKAQAAQIGLRVEADETGKVIVQSMAEARAATIEIEDAAKDAADGMGELGDAADETSESLLGARRSAADAVETTKGGSAAWLDAAQSASKFAGAAKDAGDRAYQAALAMGNAGGSIESWTRYLGSAIEAAQGAAAGYISMMESLEAQQAKINSSGAQGLEDLKLRWLELNGTEEQIAAARQARDEANVQRQIALLQIEAKRAALNGDGALARQLKDEIALMKEQLVWIAKIAAEEEKQSKARAAEAEKEEKRRAREQRDRERERNKSSDDSDSDSSPTPSRPSSNAGGGNLGGTPNNNTGNRPPVANGPVVNITLNPGANLSDRAEVERLARLIAPELQNLSRRGF